MAEYIYNPTNESATWAEFIITPGLIQPEDFLILNVPWKADDKNDVWALMRSHTKVYDVSIKQLPGYVGFDSFWEEGDAIPVDGDYIKLRLQKDPEFTTLNTVITVYRRTLKEGEDYEPNFSAASGIRTADLNKLSRRLHYTAEELDDRGRIYGNPKAWPYDDTLLLADGDDTDVIVDTHYSMTVTVDPEVISAINGSVSTDFLFYVDNLVVSPSDYTYISGVLRLDNLTPGVDPIPQEWRLVYLRAYIDNTSLSIADDSLVTAKLADGAVTTPKIADLAVTTAKIADGAITQAKLDPAVAATSYVDTSMVGDGSFLDPLSVSTTPHTTVEPAQMMLQNDAAATGWTMNKFSVVSGQQLQDDAVGLIFWANTGKPTPAISTDWPQTTKNMILNVSISRLAYDGFVSVWVSDRANPNVDIGVTPPTASPYSPWGDAWQRWYHTGGDVNTGGHGRTAAFQTIIPAGMFYMVAIWSKSSPNDALITKIYLEHGDAS